MLRTGRLLTNSIMTREFGPQLLAVVSASLQPGLNQQRHPPPINATLSP
jgi:hypothetical protein